jgi:hypothetical protein
MKVPYAEPRKAATNVGVRTRKCNGCTFSGSFGKMNGDV